MNMVEKKWKGETPETKVKQRGGGWKREIDSVVQAVGRLRVSTPSCEPCGLLAKHPAAI